MRSFSHQKLQRIRDIDYTNAQNATRRAGKEVSDPVQKFPTNPKIKIPI